MAKKSLYSRSWIRPEVFWTDLPQSVVLSVSASDPDLVELLATGRKAVQRSTRKVAEALAGVMRLGAKETLQSALLSAVNVHKRLQGLTTDPDAPDSFIVYLQGAIHLPDEDLVAVIIGSAPCSSLPGIWLAPTAKLVASEAWATHCQALQEWTADREVKKRQGKELLEQLPAEQQEKYRSLYDYPIFQEPAPVPDSAETVAKLGQGVLVPLLGKLATNRVAKLIAPLTSTQLEPPRDGEYEGILAAGNTTKHCALVAWQARGSLPSYPEIRECLQSSLRSAFARPRRSDVSPPELDFPPSGETVIVTGTVADISSVGDLPRDQLHDISFPFNNPAPMAEAGREAIRKSGFDAIGWYQSFHIWDEDTWGIYLLAEKLDELACTLHEDLRQVGERSQGLAMLLAIALVYQHELFHARVEAVVSWQELNAMQPKLRRYQKNVYAAAKGKDEWLEEALANWSSRSVILAQLPTWKMMGLVLNESSVQRVIDANLDLSPPGYRNWRVGEERETWRQFASELMTGKPAHLFKSKYLPNESLLTSPLPFDFLASDVPISIVGHGVISDLLLATPATFSTPARKEIERALKFFGYQCDKGRGKGSHELWLGEDNRGFPVPSRDPLSRGVFNSFLHHFGMNKVTYVNEIRPQL